VIHIVAIKTIMVTKRRTRVLPSLSEKKPPESCPTGPAIRETPSMKATYETSRRKVFVRYIGTIDSRPRLHAHTADWTVTITKNSEEEKRPVVASLEDALATPLLLGTMSRMRMHTANEYRLQACRQPDHPRTAMEDHTNRGPSVWPTGAAVSWMPMTDPI